MKLPRHYRPAYESFWKAQLDSDFVKIFKEGNTKCDAKSQANANDCATAITMLLDDPTRDINYHQDLAVSDLILHSLIHC